jgi:hypothetical protein
MTNYWRRQVPRSGFSDWPALKKHKKKVSPLKSFIHQSKLQASISDEIQPTEVSACFRLLPLHPRRFRSAN